MGKIIRMGGQEASQDQNTQGSSLGQTVSNIFGFPQQIQNIKDFNEQGLRNVSQAGQGLAEGAAGLLGLPGSLYELARMGTGGIASLTGSENPLPENKYIPTSSSLIGHVKDIEKAILPESHVNPKGFKEKVLRESGSLLPTTAATIALGGATLPALGRNLASSIGSVIGGDLAGDFGKVVGGLAGNFGFNKLYNWINKSILKGADPKTLSNLAEETRSQLYERERQLGKGVVEKIPTYREDLLHLEKELEKSLAFKDASQKKDLLNRIKNYLTESNFDEVEISNLIKRKKEINSILPQVQGPQYKQYREYLERMQKAMFDAADRAGITNPEWEKSWRAADNITKAMNYGQQLNQTIEKAPSLIGYLKHPLAHAAIGATGGGALGGLFGAAIGTGTTLAGHGLKYAANLGFQKGKQLIGFMNSPETQALLAKAFGYTLEGNIPALAKTYQTINSRATKYAKKNPEKKETHEKRSSGSIVRMGS